MQNLAEWVSAFQWDLSLLGTGELKMTGSMDIDLKTKNCSNLMSLVIIVPEMYERILLRKRLSEVG